MNRWTGIFILAIALGCEEKGDDEGGEEAWWDEDHPPDELCADYAAVAGPTCSPDVSSQEENACLDSYLVSYEAGCLDLMISLIECMMANSTLFFCSEGEVAFDYTVACTEDAEAWSACVE